MISKTIFAGAAVGVLALFLGSAWYSAAKTGNILEQSVKAEYTNLKNILAQYGNKVAETAQVPEIYRDDVSKVAVDAITARFGENGSKALFQAISEQNPTLDSAVYVQLQRVIESGRNDFQNSQTKFIDKRRVYETALGSPWQGMWLNIAGYPRIDLDDYDIVTSVRAEDAFEKKVEEPIKLR